MSKENRYMYKGVEYKVIHDCTFKDPLSREWIDGYVYMSVCDITAEYFVREKVEFDERFLRLEE